MNDLIAIDTLLEPDQTMIDNAVKFNTQLRGNYPAGYSLDSSHTPHITTVQRFIKKSDLPVWEKAVSDILAKIDLTNIELTANGLYYLPYENIGLAGITVIPNPILEFHNEIVEAVKPFSVENGTGAAFAPRPDGKDIMAPTVEYVNKFIPDHSSKNYKPHVSIGVGYQTFLDELLRSPFEKFSFGVTSVSIYHLGEFGTAQEKLASIKLK